MTEPHIDTKYQTKILGTGSASPETRLTNHEISKRVETSHDWIVERTGIVERRVSNPERAEATSDLALAAARRALEASGLQPSDLDMILVATVSPEFLTPSTACIVHERLKAPTRCAALDINAACSGFVYGLSIADAMIRSGQAKRILLIGTEHLTKLLDWNDRNTCILFGDGAGAAVLSAEPEGSGSRIYSSHLYADGSLKELFTIPIGGFMQMKGKEIFKVAVKMLADGIDEALHKSHFKPADLSWIVPHQANNRIIEAVARRLDFPMERVLVNVQSYGNTSAASTPIIFDEAVRDGRIKRGDLVCFSVFGAGLTYGAALLRY